ncbi:MAG: hypothetical protein KBD31_04305 [Proteobacteria bacterium]|nr:hypothetical protein [Pseudomonadota bacterium]
METVLTLSVGGLPPLSARGCEQILKPIQLGLMKRSVNGDLFHLGPQILKYQSIIRAKDQTVLASNGLYPGVIVDVGCIQPIWEKLDNQKGHILMRKAIESSIVVMNDTQENLFFNYSDGKIILKDLNKAYDVFICYRPVLKMRVTDFLIKTNEWTFESQWELTLEEV